MYNFLQVASFVYNLQEKIIVENQENNDSVNTSVPNLKSSL